MFSATGKVNFSLDEFTRSQGKRATQIEHAQELLTLQVIRNTDRYVPMDTGMLATSPRRASDLRNGIIIYNMPYAARLYYGTRFNFSKDKHPSATHHWFEKSKSIYLDYWGTYVAKLIGGFWRRT